MALITCPECEHQVSDAATSCPSCGFPMHSSPAIPPNEEEIIVSDPAVVKKGNSLPKNKLLIRALVAAIILIVIISKARFVNFEKVFSYYEDEIWCTIAEDNSYVKFDTNYHDLNDHSDLMAGIAIKIANEKLGFDDSLYAKMESTSSLDGIQTASNFRVNVSWSYHPDKGLEVIYENK